MDSLELYLQNTIDLCIKIEALNKQALSLLRKNPKKSKQLAEEAELLSTDNNLPRGKAFATHLISLYHLSTGNLRLAVLKSNEALEIFTELNEEQGMSSTLNTLGISYRNSGNYDRGLDCFMKSLDIKTRLGDKKNIMKLYGNIGNIFENLEQYDNSKLYYLKGLKIAEEMNNAKVIADSYSNLGACYHQLKNYEQSIDFHRKALKRRMVLKDKKGISHCYNNLGLIFEEQKKYELALQYYLNSLDIKIELNMKIETAQACNTVGNLYTLMNDHKNAEQYLKKGRILAQKINSDIALRQNHICLTNHYKIHKNYKKALFHHIEYHKLDRKILNQTRISKLQAQLHLIDSELYTSNKKLEIANKKLNTLSLTDGLTGIPNRRRFDEFLLQEWNRCKREATPISLLIFDIDMFKLFNDTYGHTAGDDCLKLIAKAIWRSAKRSTDLTARYGGEEFAVILSNTDKKGAKEISRIARSAVEELKILHKKSPISEFVTVSVGITTVIPNLKESSSELINKADKALYFSKEHGRNRITMYDEHN